jgi:asparagine synthase (glutamine-hydrolysing)
MCGICGQVRDDTTRVDPGLIARMCAAQAHRGPDARGAYVHGGSGLGIQRLRVIDLETGDQPVFNEDGSVVVVLNGEIYNYAELRRRLIQRGHSFSTAGDTEVIAHAYEERGPGCIAELQGMFALAIWDTRRRRLVLARDRVGKKPLFYSYRNRVLSFASELRALLQDGSIPREVDLQAVDAYLCYGWVPGPRSAFAAIRKLPPATTLVFENGRLDLRRYWRLDYSAALEFSDEDELHEALRARILDAVRRRMISDVPLGAFLSGGIDSSAVVAAMAQVSSEPVKTFSIGFTTDRYDELPKARLVSELFATDHEEMVVEPRAAELLPVIVRHYGEPFADSSAVPSFYVAQMARRYVTVALNGDGGDESFAGYERYVANLALDRAAAIPLTLRKALASVGRAVPPSGRINSWRSRARRVADALALDPAQRHASYLTGLDSSDRSHLYSADFAAVLSHSIAADVFERAWADSTATDSLDRMLDVDVRTYLVDDLLVKMDIATMAHSLEARSPFLDHELMQFAASLPAGLKLRAGSKKRVLRNALRGWLPDEILDAPKMGFRVPAAEWLRTDLRELTEDVLFDETAVGRGYFEIDSARALFARHVDGIEDRSQALWTLLVFELWHREVVDPPAPAPSTPRALSAVPARGRTLGRT